MSTSLLLPLGRNTSSLGAFPGVGGLGGLSGDGEVRGVEVKGAEFVELSLGDRRNSCTIPLAVLSSANGVGCILLFVGLCVTKRNPHFYLQRLRKSSFSEFCREEKIPKAIQIKSNGNSIILYAYAKLA